MTATFEGELADNLDVLKKLTFPFHVPLLQHPFVPLTTPYECCSADDRQLQGGGGAEP